MKRTPELRNYGTTGAMHFLVVLQKLTGEHDGREAHLLFSSGGHSKQAGDERDLFCDMPLCHTMHLPFPKHVHALVSL